MGRYCSYILPRQYGGTSQIEVNRRLLPRRMITLYLGGKALEASASIAVTVLLLTPESKVIGRFVGVTLEQTRPWKGTGVVVDTFCHLFPCWVKNTIITFLYHKLTFLSGSYFSKLFIYLPSLPFGSSRGSTMDLIHSTFSVSPCCQSPMGVDSGMPLALFSKG